MWACLPLVAVVTSDSTWQMIWCAVGSGLLALAFAFVAIRGAVPKWLARFLGPGWSGHGR